MPFMAEAGWLAVVTVSTAVMVTRLVKYALQSQTDVPLRYVKVVFAGYAGYLLWLVWEGLARFADAAWNVIL